MSALALSPRRVAKNTFSQIVSFGLGTAAYAAAAILVARSQGPSGLGVFSPAWQMAIIVSVVALVGIDQLLIRELNRGRTNELGSTVTLATITCLGAGLLTALIPVLIGEPAAVNRAFIAAGIYVAASGPTLVARAAFHARERMELESVSMFAEAVVALIAMPIVLARGGGAAAVIGALAAGRVVSLVISLLLVRRVFGAALGASVTGWRSKLRAGLALGIASTFTGFFLRFDVIVVGALQPVHEAGLYSAAAVVTFALPMIVNALARSLYPVLSRAEGGLADPELRSVFARAWSVLLVLGIGAAMTLSLLAGDALELVYGEAFGDAAGLLAALAWLLPVRFLNGLCAITLNATGWTRRHEALLGSVVVVNLVASVVGVAVFGAWGAFYASATTEIAILVLLVSALHRVKPPVVRPILFAGLAAGGTALAAALVPGGVIVRGAACGVAALAAALIAAVAGGRGDQPAVEARPVMRQTERSSR